MAQYKAVLEYIQTHGFITDADAAEMGIQRLGSCIYQLRKKGYNIHTTRYVARNRYGTFSNYGKYTLE